MAHSTITLELPIFVEISEISCRLESSFLATCPIESNWFNLRIQVSSSNGKENQLQDYSESPGNQCLPALKHSVRFVLGTCLFVHTSFLCADLSLIGLIYASFYLSFYFFLRSILNERSIFLPLPPNVELVKYSFLQGKASK